MRTSKKWIKPDVYKVNGMKAIKQIASEDRWIKWYNLSNHEAESNGEQRKKKRKEKQTNI